LPTCARHWIFHIPITKNGTAQATRAAYKANRSSLVARIFAIADVWDAVTSSRPYRKAWTKKKALAYIKQQSGKHFDPHIVEVFMQGYHLNNQGYFGVRKFYLRVIPK
jgi:hypothetical protein